MQCAITGQFFAIQIQFVPVLYAPFFKAMHVSNDVIMIDYAMRASLLGQLNGIVMDSDDIPFVLMTSCMLRLLCSKHRVAFLENISISYFVKTFM